MLKVLQLSKESDVSRLQYLFNLINMQFQIVILEHFVCIVVVVLVVYTRTDCMK